MPTILESADVDVETEVSVSPNKAYLDILNAYRDGILRLSQGERYFSKDKNGSTSDLRVSFCDITNDGIDEMFFVEGNEALTEAIPHVYTFVDGDAVEMQIDNGGIKGVERYKGSGERLFYAVAAGGSANVEFLVFLGTDGNVYVIDREQDDMNNYYINVYEGIGNDRLVRTKEIANLVHPSSDYSTTIDEYYVNGKIVDYSQGAKEFTSLKDVYKNTILYNGKLGDLSVMQKVDAGTNLAMSFDEAVDYLNSK